MQRGSDKHGSKLEQELADEAEALERSRKEPRSQGAREQEAPADEPGGSGHRVAGTGSSADEYSYKDHGEVGGASHPKPKDPEERSDRL